MEFEQSGTGNEEYEHENEVRKPLGSCTTSSIVRE
jgi:hypothetical protein